MLCIAPTGDILFWCYFFFYLQGLCGLQEHINSFITATYIDGPDVPMQSQM